MIERTRIVFFDSGIGGLAYLEPFISKYPAVHLSYFADFARFPYGEKAADVVERRVLYAAGELIKEEHPDLFVVACNTASVVALHSLRKSYPGIPFVGVVPAVKPAAEATKTGRLLVLSTARTAHDPYTIDLEDRFAADCSVHRIGVPALVDAVEESFCSPHRDVAIQAILQQTVLPGFSVDTDVIVLACTHFIHTKETLRSLLPDNVTIIDSVDGVIRRVADLLALENFRENKTERPDEKVRLYFSGDGILPARYRCLADRYMIIGVPW